MLAEKQQIAVAARDSLQTRFATRLALSREVLEACRLVAGRTDETREGVSLLLEATADAADEDAHVAIVPRAYDVEGNAAAGRFVAAWCDRGRVEQQQGGSYVAVVSRLTAAEVWSLLEDPRYGYVHFSESADLTFVRGYEAPSTNAGLQQFDVLLRGRVRRWSSVVVEDLGPRHSRRRIDLDGRALEAEVRVSDSDRGAVIERIAYDPDTDRPTRRGDLKSENRLIVLIWKRNLQSLDWLRRGPIT